MTENQDLAVAPGRPVRLVPTPSGFWMTLLGVATAVLAPLFGFLVGSASGMPEDNPLLSPMYWGLFVGVVAAVIGGRRLWLDAHREETRRENLREDAS